MGFKDKIKNYSFWTGLSGAVVIALNAISKVFGFEVNNKIVEEVIMSVCGVLVAFGVVCLPIKTTTKQDIDQTKQEQCDNVVESKQEQCDNVVESIQE